MSKVPISEEERQLPYYKYYEMGIDPITPEQAAYIENCMGTIEESLPVSRRNELLEVQRVPGKTGYFPLAEGGVLVASNVPMPGVTGDMMFWWTAWHCSGGPLRYAIWDPEDHYAATCDEAGIKRLHDHKIPMREKTWGTVQSTTESIGGPPVTITMRIQNPADVGFDLNLLGTDSCQYISCACAQMGPIPIFVAASLAKGENGIPEMRERFWIGYDIIDGVGKCLIPPGAEMPDMNAICKSLIAHNFKEFGKLSKMLPSLYAEEKDNW